MENTTTFTTGQRVNVFGKIVYITGVKADGSKVSIDRYKANWIKASCVKALTATEERELNQKDAQKTHRLVRSFVKSVVQLEVYCETGRVLPNRVLNQVIRSATRR